MGVNQGKILKQYQTDQEIRFHINGNLHTVVQGLDKITPETSLNTYLRNYAGSRDVKVMCREGGCGVCIVAVTFYHPLFQKMKTYAINSCLIPILSCHNWHIETVCSIGNREIGYNDIQQTLAKFGGSQCGFCSPGMVMNMYALKENQENLTMQQVENSFGGNLCRCTGYRPIMDAFKSLASDADSSLISKIPDIEDIKICKKSNKKCNQICTNEKSKPIYLKFIDSIWVQVYTIQHILDLFKFIGNASYRFVSGNTAKGVYPNNDKPNFYIDIRNVSELITYSIVEKYLILGANISIADLIEILKEFKETDGFFYVKELLKHLDLIANVSVRNFGTLAGNLSIKHDHHDFPSDIFLLFETLGAKVTIVQQNGVEVKKKLNEYLNYNMHKCILKNILLPCLNKDIHLFKTFKIMPRAQNAHAYINAGYLIENNSSFKVTSAKIIYGGISSDFIHAKSTEQYLINKQLYDNDTIQGALKILNNELTQYILSLEQTAVFRKQLAMNLFYKFILATASKDKLNPKYLSGGLSLEQSLSKGVQFYQTDKSMFPVTKPVPKNEALHQTSGEALYIDDLPNIPGQLYGEFVLAETLPLSLIKNINTTNALNMPGVVGFVDHKDIPGKNLFCSPPLNITEEELFCSGKVIYNGQPVGIIVANTYDEAVEAAKMVKITYEKTNEIPALNIKDVLNQNNQERIKNMNYVEPTRKGDNIKHIIKGEFSMHGQYHFTMETQNCVCVPNDDGSYDLYAGTQWMNICQKSAATALNLPMSKINVIVKRLGGGYGAKLLRAAMISTACAVASHKLHKPVRLILSLNSNMKAIGKRMPFYANYEVGVDENGLIQYLDTTYYQDAGSSGSNEQMVAYIDHYMKSGYIHDTWKLNANLVQTDMAGNAYARGPGSTEAIALIESIMEHIAHVIDKSPLQVRLANLETTSENLSEFINEAIIWSEYEKRLKKVEIYNQNNKWIKKGLSLAFMNHRFVVYHPYSVLVSVFAPDGTVAISHGGIECGQGINTKVVQVCSHEFKIPLEWISIKPSINYITPNNQMTGGSVTSEAVCYATIQACKEIKRRLNPIKQRNKDLTWKELVWKAFLEDVELCTTHMFTSKSEQPYNIPGVSITEVQVDMLTGEHIVNRVDLLEDVGSSINPGIDVGQIEGAFIMGLGLNTSEKLIYGKEGELLTHNTWTYKIPGVKDIPKDFRIKFKENGTNPGGILNSKACGEPALNLAICVPFAIRNALKSARQETDSSNDKFIEIDGPTTLEFTLENCLTDFENYLL